MLLEFAKKITVDLAGQETPAQTLIIKTDDVALIAAITDTVRRFNDTHQLKSQRILKRTGQKLGNTIILTFSLKLSPQAILASCVHAHTCTRATISVTPESDAAAE